MIWKIFAASIILASSALAAETPTIKPEDASDHVDEEVIVEFEVRSSHLLQDKNVGFLNSERNNRDAKNFTAFITPQGMRSFKDKKVENPSAEYLGKKIRVKGKVLLHKEKPEIKVERADQLEVVKEKKSEDDADGDKDDEEDSEPSAE